MNRLNIEIVNVGIIGTNCYIVYGENKEAVIIDAGDDAHNIFARVEELGVKPVAELLTHGHFDHIHAVEEVASKYDIPVYAGADEVRLLGDDKLNGSAFYRRPCIVEKYETIADGSEIVLGGMKFKVIYTPGHTEGSVCYYVEDEAILFSGDTLFRESIGRTDMATGDERLILESLARLMELDDEVEVLPGHSEASTIGYERRFNPYVRDTIIE